MSLALWRLVYRPSIALRRGYWPSIACHTCASSIWEPSGSTCSGGSTSRNSVCSSGGCSRAQGVSGAVGGSESCFSFGSVGSHHRGKRTRAWQLADGMAEGLGREIVHAGALVLREEAEDVPDSMLGTPELRTLVQSMIDTMRAAPGVGLAAPQIGVPLKLIVLEDRPEYIALVPEGLAEQQQRRPFEPLVIVNPRITALTDAGARFFEGCLSVPGYQALVERYLSVQVDGLTPEGLPLRITANGWQARILQHECDHLAGVLYVDRMLPRSFAARGNGGRLPDDVPRPGLCRCAHPVGRVGF